MADDPKLIVGLEARLDKFEKGLREAGLIAEREVKNIERSFNRADLLAGITQGIGQELARMAAQFVKQIPQALAEVAKIADISEAVGVSTEQIQVLRFALEQSGGSAQQADAALKRFADTVVDAGRGVGTLAKWFEANNIAVKNADGSMRSMNALLADTARLIQNARSPQEKLNLAADAFGKSAAPAMVAALKDGTAGLQEFANEAREAGIIMSDTLIKQAAVLDDEFSKLTATMSTMGKTLAVTVASEFRETLKGMAEQTRQIGIEWRTLTLGMIEFTQKLPGVGFAFKKELDEMDRLLKAQLRTLETVKTVGGFAPRAAREGPSPLAEDAAATRVTVSPLPKQAAESKSAVDRLNESMSKSLELSKAELATIGMTIQQQEKARADALLTEAMKRDGLTTETAITQEIRRQAGEQAKTKQLYAERNAQQQEMLSLSRDIGSTLSDSMKALVLEGQKFDQVLKNIGNRIASKAFDKLFDVMFAAPAGGGGSLFTSLFGGGRMAGGPVRGGSAYLVGERGPELFVPNKSGQVIPNTALSNGGGGVTIGGQTTNVVVQGSADRQTLGLMQQMLAARDRRFVADVAHATAELRRRSAFA